MNKILAFTCAVGIMLLASCSLDGDGPMNISSDFSYSGKGFFEEASLDSGKTIHLASKPLWVSFHNIWSFSDCAFSSIDLGDYVEDSVLILKPKVNYLATNEDCPTSMYRPDTTVKVVFDNSLASLISEVRIYDNSDSLLDSVLVRRGRFARDTFEIFIDSSFNKGTSLPLRTKDSPSVLRVLDSINVRTFYWRTIKSECTSRADACESVVNDTLFPATWFIGDTTLVPVRKTCVDTNKVYCVSTKWKNDSTHLGKLEEKLDTLWRVSSYYIEEIPEYGGLISFNWGALNFGKKTFFSRELFIPKKDETRLSPASRKDLVIYDLTSGQMLTDSAKVDSLYDIWQEADVAPDTLVTGSPEKK